MKKALTLVAVVASYSIVETLLLLSTLLPNDPYMYRTLYQVIIWWGQPLLIPGSAALFSWAMYGRSGWSRRSLFIFAFGALGVPLMISVLLAVLLALEWISSVTWEPPSVIAVPIVLLIGFVCAFIVGLLSLVRWGARRSIRIETTTWMTDRQSGICASEIQWRNRGIRWASWLPVAIVLLVFSFLPEIWGVLSHVAHPSSGVVGRYRISVPITWVIVERQEGPDPGEAYAVGLAGRGFALDSLRYVRNDLPLSEWNVRITQSQQTTNHEWALRRSEITGLHNFTIGEESVSCVEYWPAYLQRPNHTAKSGNVFVDCVGSRRLSASLVGERVHLARFYRMLEGIRMQ